MGVKVAIGLQSFEKIRENNIFYVDKTDFIKDWWEKEDSVTLITRPPFWKNFKYEYGRMLFF